jgi:hypothetical protein
VAEVEILRKIIPRRLKPVDMGSFTARLKPCPFKTWTELYGTGEAVPLQNFD